MDIFGSGVTAAFLGIILALVRLVEWLLKRRGEEAKKPVAQNYNGLGRVHDRLVEMKGGLDSLKERVAESNEEYRAVAKEMAEMKGTYERFGDKIDNLSSKIDKLEPLPGQMGRLADAIIVLKDEIRKQQ